MRDNTNKLGRGFQDLIEENLTEITKNEEIIEIPIDKVYPNPDQPRTVFNDKALTELSNSIAEHGLISPVIVRNSVNGYILVAGERRVRAAKLAGLDTISAVVRDYNQIRLAELALIENLQRKDLTPIEEAVAFQTVISRLGLTHEELGKRIGKSRVYVTNILGLLNLPATIIESVNKGIISMGHARALSKIRNIDTCLQLHERILNDDLTVRQTEQIIREITQSKNDAISKKHIEYTRNVLKTELKDKVRFDLQHNRLTFKFKSKTELHDIIQLIIGGRDNE